jgi:hypothetical protein
MRCGRCGGYGVGGGGGADEYDYGGVGMDMRRPAHRRSRRHGGPGRQKKEKLEGAASFLLVDMTARAILGNNRRQFNHRTADGCTRW